MSVKCYLLAAVTVAISVPANHKKNETLSVKLIETETDIKTTCSRLRSAQDVVNA